MTCFFMDTHYFMVSEGATKIQVLFSKISSCEVDVKMTNARRVLELRRRYYGRWRVLWPIVWRCGWVGDS